MSLKTKRLKEVPIGTSLTVYFAKESVFSGNITDRDEECVSISDGNRELFIDYEDVKIFIEEKNIIAASSKKQKSEQKTETADPAESGKKSTPAPVSISLPIVKPGFFTDIFPPDISDDAFKVALSANTPYARRKLQTYKDRFISAGKADNKEKQKNCLYSLLDFVQKDVSLVNDEKVWKLIALMSLRCGEKREEYFIKGKAFYYAAQKSYSREKYDDACVYAALTILYESNLDYDIKVVYSILFQCSIQTNDASAVVWLFEEIEISTLEMELLRALFASKGQEYKNTNSINEIKKLLEFYPNQGHIIRLMLIVNQNHLTREKESSSSGASTKNIPAGTIYGKIVKLAWSKEEGTIAYGDNREQSCAFHYNDILDNKLLEKVKKTYASEVENKNWQVSFQIVGDRAIQIQEKKDFSMSASELNDASDPSFLEYLNSFTPSEALNKANEIFNKRSDPERCIDALVFYEFAIKDENLQTIALTGYFHSIATYFDLVGSNGISENLRNKALALYREYDEKISHRFSYDFSSFVFLKDFGETDEVIKSINRVLQYEELKPFHRSRTLLTLSDIYYQRAKQSEDKNDYQLAIDVYQKWRNLYHAESSVNSDIGAKNIYYNRILLNLSTCYMALEMPDQALPLLEKILEYNPKSKDAKNLYNSILTNNNGNKEEAKAEEINSEEKEEEKKENTEGIEETEAGKPEIFEIEEETEENNEEFDNIPPYEEVAGWEDLSTTEEEAIQEILSLRGEKNLYTLSLLKVFSDANEKFKPLYLAVSYAVDNPMENLSMISSDIMEAFGDMPENEFGIKSKLYDYSYAAATLRSAFSDGVDYVLPSLIDMVPLVEEYPILGEIYTLLSDFKKQTRHGADIFSAYRLEEITNRESQKAALQKKAEKLYNNEYANPHIREKISNQRYKIAKTFIYEKDGVLERALRAIKDDDIPGFEEARKGILEVFIRENRELQSRNIDSIKMETFINSCWEKAGKDSRIAEDKSSTLMSGLRNNFRNHVLNALSIICEMEELYEFSVLDQAYGAGRKAFSAIEESLKANLQELYGTLLSIKNTTDDEEATAISLLLATVDELLKKLNGEWNEKERKYFFVDFLRTNAILLDENFLPDFTSTFYSLPNFHILARLRRHIADKEASYESHASKIYSRERFYHNFGDADRLAEFSADCPSQFSWEKPENAENYLAIAEENFKESYQQFVEDLQLANSKGQIVLRDPFMVSLEDTALYWYVSCLESKNYGFFLEFVDICMKKIREDAGEYKNYLLQVLNTLHKNSPDLFEDPATYIQIEEQINDLNFLVAEDWMSRLKKGNFHQTGTDQIKIPHHLMDFWNEFQQNYKTCSDFSVSLKKLASRVPNLPAKDKRGGQSLINNWLHNGQRSNPTMIESIFTGLGWSKFEVTPTEIHQDSYRIKFQDQNTKRTYPHPISAFGTSSKLLGFHVICLYGYYNVDRLLETYRQLDNIAGNKIILLDYALNAADRRKLARKMREVTLFHTYLLIDRVTIFYIANHYATGMNNEMLMAISMPFTYYQPYSDNSSSDMDPEMFIGREEELSSIENPRGANLLFGGRQLGKSSLLKKAKNDIDGDELGRRALFIDIKNLNFEKAALKISRELIDKDILPDASETSDWDDLERALTKRLLDTENEIPFLLLNLDEADELIKSSENFDFHPLVCLKNIQQSTGGRFKFVLAGLHDLVRFNRSVALGKNSVIAHLPSLNIKPFKYEDAQKLLLTPLGYLGFFFEEDQALITHILAATSYFPGLIHLYCQKLIEAMKVNYANYNESETPPYIVNNSHIQKVLADPEFRNAIKNKFEITLALDPVYHMTALLMALLDDEKANPEGYTAADILGKATELELPIIVSLDEDKMDAYLAELTDLNILKTTKEKSYLFCTKNFRDTLGNTEEVQEKLLELMSKAEEGNHE